LTKREPIKPFNLAKRKTKVRVEIPAPLALAAVQFLSTSKRNSKFILVKRLHYIFFHKNRCGALQKGSPFGSHPSTSGAELRSVRQNAEG
jgi:hypothetical protein